MKVHQTVEPLKLSVIGKLLDALHQSETLYCHWKSNDHLDAVMAGKSDLDILFEEGQEATIERIVTDLGFKLFRATTHKQYPSIYDYLTIDLASGMVVHLHAHFKLRFGHMYRLQYHTNLESVILSSRVFDHHFGIFRIDPSLEWIFFHIRESLKLKGRHILRFKLAGHNLLKAKQQVEYTWLKNQRNKDKSAEFLKNHFSKWELIHQQIEQPLQSGNLIKLRSLFKKELHYSSSDHPFYGWLKRTFIDFSQKLRTKKALYFDAPEVLRRYNPRRGVSVALIGADGSGKSTISQDLHKTFNVKLDVYAIYFGRGDGKASIPRRFLKAIKSKVKKKNKKKQSTLPKNSENLRKPRGIKLYAKIIEALLVSREKQRNLNRMRKAKEKGLLVICDRFPQNQISGYNDGPLLSYLSNSKNPLLRYLARVESRVYDNAQKNPPDLIVKLIASPDIVEARKPGETSIENLTRKVEGIKSIHFNEPCETVVIDASTPLNEVLATVKAKVWDKL